jgi:hypothetical protein
METVPIHGVLQSQPICAHKRSLSSVFYARFLPCIGVHGRSHAIYNLATLHPLSSLPRYALLLSTRCPLTAEGDGGASNGSDKAEYTFRNSPDELFALHGYTEYLELEYDSEIYGAYMLV